MMLAAVGAVAAITGRPPQECRERPLTSERS